MAFAGHRRCGFCILVLTSINPWLPRIYQTNSKPSCWGGFFNKTCGRAFAAIIVAPYPWPMLSVGTTSAVLAAVPRGIEHQAAVSQRSGRRHFAGDPCASWIVMATFWKCSRKKQGRRAHGCAACVCHASLHSGGAHSCAACVSFFVWPFRQQDSKTRAAVLLPRALDKWLLVTSQLFALLEKMLRPKHA